jgi:hypothetical protein
MMMLFKDSESLMTAVVVEIVIVGELYTNEKG